MGKTEEDLQIEFVEDSFRDGSKNIKVTQKTGEEKEKVKLELDKRLLPYSHKTVDLLSPYSYHERTILHLYTEELISLLPQVREEDIINPLLFSVIETLLFALDYLTHSRFSYIRFEDKYRNKLYEIFNECFEIKKVNMFSEYANRPKLNKSSWYQDGDEVYCLDKREEKTRIFLSVVYPKPKHMMEHFKNVGLVLTKVILKPNTSNVTYEEMLDGKTDHDLHVDTLFYLGMVQRTLRWVLNSASWRENDLYTFDEMEIRCKLGLK
jgi:hypothetical protein